jgi:hypothetical protein
MYRTLPGDRWAPVQRVVPGCRRGRVAIVDGWGSSYQDLESDKRKQIRAVTRVIPILLSGRGQLG